MDDQTFNADRLFETLYTRLCKGDVLITVATPPMSPEEESRTGLVSSHAYAVLAVQKVNVSHIYYFYVHLFNLNILSVNIF